MTRQVMSLLEKHVTQLNAKDRLFVSKIFLSNQALAKDKIEPHYSFSIAACFKICSP